MLLVHGSFLLAATDVMINASIFRPKNRCGVSQAMNLNAATIKIGVIWNFGTISKVRHINLDLQRN